ncbi:MAG: class I SAM-dependent methyltransferase [Actinobacteria bacterium]|nr:class I SAM-dependent methyltransferase [Actinomycetota bacterium]
MNETRGYRRTPVYSTSAAIYDRMVGHYAFEHWRDNFERLERRYDLDISRVADAACGTGLASAYLVERGAEVYASDLSLPMLAEAARLHGRPGVCLQRQDMRYLYPPSRVTLVNCATDAMNHLLYKADLRRALSSFRAALEPGGHAIFDLNTAWQLREGSDTVPWEFEVDGRRMRWSSAWEEVSSICTLNMVFIDVDLDGSDIVEVHRERAYETAWVMEELARAGFDSAEVMDATGLGKAGEQTRRLQFVAGV